MQILDGIATSKIIIHNLKAYIDLVIKNKQRPPHLAAILIGQNPASQSYVKSKVNMCKKIGIESTLVRKEDIASESELLEIVNDCAKDKAIDGILVQLPLPEFVDSNKILYAIPPEKDVDGFHTLNVGKLTLGIEESFVSATPLGIKMLLMAYGIVLEGKHVVIVGRSNIVGRPLSILMSMNDKAFGNATVTLCHSKTQDIEKITTQADILVSCIGKAGYITENMVKENAIVVDVGINRIEVDGVSKLVGDVDFEKVAPKTSYITPVPGGVGRMTIAALMYNTVLAYNKRENLKDSSVSIENILKEKI